MNTAYSRRDFLTRSSTAALVVAAGWSTPSSAQAISVDDFLGLSQSLTGKTSLDEDIAAAMLDAFRSNGQADAVSALMNGESDADLENEIVAAWYSGVSPNPDDLTVLTYTDALMWDAMPYTKPMGYCGGATGYWAEPPTI